MIRRYLFPVILFLISINLFSENNDFIIKKILTCPSGKYYAITEKNGFIVSINSGRSWVKKNNGLPAKIVYPFDSSEITEFNSLGIDPMDENRIVINNSVSVYYSDNAGESWKKLSLGGDYKASDYITCAAIKPFSRSGFLIGTSYSGFMESDDNGISWSNKSSNFSSIYRGAGFYEEIESLTYDPRNLSRIYINCSFRTGLFIFNKENGTFEKLELSSHLKSKNLVNIRFFRKTESRDDWSLDIDDRDLDWTYSYKGKWKKRDLVLKTDNVSSKKSFRFKKAVNKTGIYLSSYNSRTPKIKQHIEFIKSHGYNSIVVDLKDDNGFLTYNTSLDFVKKNSFNLRILDIKELINICHENGIYVIGRIVVFKDKNLFKYNNKEFALWNKNSNDSWGKFFEVKDDESGETYYEQREFWVDPFSEFVWDYNISIAHELEMLGIDEVQFDYIRFPSDGPLSSISYRHRKDGMTRSDALESFLRKAREKINIPISTDLYGFNSWYRMGNWIGQNLEILSKYVDVICPMYYPSHFPDDFLKDLSYLERAEKIYNEGSSRTYEITKGKCIVRPFVQAFLIGKELRMEEHEYTAYLEKQIKGVKQSRASGFTLWNASNRYYMVRKAKPESVENLSKSRDVEDYIN